MFSFGISIRKTTDCLEMQVLFFALSIRKLVPKFPFNAHHKPPSHAKMPGTASSFFFLPFPSILIIYFSQKESIRA